MSIGIPVTFPVEDCNGQISYLEAFDYASDYGLPEKFILEYKQLYGERVDFGELIAWVFDTLSSS
jgi:bacillopeptidase F (M6 metalloprotease family)